VVDGKSLQQSKAILRFAGKFSKLYPGTCACMCVFVLVCVCEFADTRSSTRLYCAYINHVSRTVHTHAHTANKWNAAIVDEWLDCIIDCNNKISRTIYDEAYKGDENKELRLKARTELVRG
jgi:hypothetical protein